MIGEVSVMPRKQVNVAKEAAPAVVRTAKSRTPRIRTAKHSKSAVISETIADSQSLISHESIAVVAYGYWESRGYQGGNPQDDWFRAEAELRRATN